MKLNLLKGIISFVILLLLQAIILNHIHLFGYATPLLYVYLVLLFPRNYPRWRMLLLCFIMGLCVDIFSNTMGVATASITFMGFIQPYLLAYFIPRNSIDDLQPSMNTLGINKFIYYTLISVFVYCVLFFTLEVFSFFNWEQCLASIIGSTILTVVIILVVENFRRSSNK